MDINFTLLISYTRNTKDYIDILIYNWSILRIHSPPPTASKWWGIDA